MRKYRVLTSFNTGEDLGSQDGVTYRSGLSRCSQNVMINETFSTKPRRDNDGDIPSSSKDGVLAYEKREVGLDSFSNILGIYCPSEWAERGGGAIALCVRPLLTGKIGMLGYGGVTVVSGREPM